MGLGVEQRHQIFHLPDPIRQPCGHRRGRVDPFRLLRQRSVRPAEVVGHEVAGPRRAGGSRPYPRVVVGVQDKLGVLVQRCLQLLLFFLGQLREFLLDQCSDFPIAPLACGKDIMG